MKHSRISHNKMPAAPMLLHTPCLQFFILLSCQIPYTIVIDPSLSPRGSTTTRFTRPNVLSRSPAPRFSVAAAYEDANLRNDSGQTPKIRCLFCLNSHTLPSRPSFGSNSETCNEQNNSNMRGCLLGLTQTADAHLPLQFAPLPPYPYPPYPPPPAPPGPFPSAPGG